MAHKRSIGLAGVTNLSVMAPIKFGIASGFEPISYLERLRKVLDALQSARRNLRESELRASVFPDTIGRLGIIHNFRYAIVPPLPLGSAIEGTPWHLSLNVTFDGGWEPYMRVIYRDIGDLLDLLFCHSPGYPNSRTSAFQEYCAWVRRNEVEGGLFYADAPVTLEDQKYLSEVEKLQRESGTSSDIDIARYGLPSAARQRETALKHAEGDPATALVLPLRTLKGLYRLSNYFSNKEVEGGAGDMEILRRFAQSVLKEPIAAMKAIELKMATALRGDAETEALCALQKMWRTTKASFKDELEWVRFTTVRTDSEEPAKKPLPSGGSKVLQSHLVGNESMSHGCLVLLRVIDSQPARSTLVALAKKCGPVLDGAVGYLVAFTYAGLDALELSQQARVSLAPEFIEGMEARCSLLGDVRSNHPDHWKRPLAKGFPTSPRQVDLKTVHVVVFMRTADHATENHQLHKRFEQEIADLEQVGSGLAVLAQEPTRSVHNVDKKTSGHLGFADGISQPQFEEIEGQKLTPDHVSAGEILLGYSNDRGDLEDRNLDPLLKNGSYLVVRKLRQHMDRLKRVTEALSDATREDLLAKMMGRHSDGSPLHTKAGSAATNDFTFKEAETSDACPFQSHIRRANPRDGRPYTPRILRRGMSYGPPERDAAEAERGVLFMAYCASIAEQFEVIQRWMSGGNSSGVGSAQGDPFLRVPKHGESNTFRYIDVAGQKAVRVAFEDKPLVSLEWGMYLFVPALKALEDLNYFAEARAAKPTAAQQRASATAIDLRDFESAREILEDPEACKAVWEKVRADKADYLETPYGKLVGKYDQVLKVMRSDRTQYSVEGYGERMTHSVGLNLLGVDRSTADPQPPLNKAVASIDEGAAFAVTLAIVRSVLDGFSDLPFVDKGDAVRRPIDLINFSDHVLAELCKHWIGLPDGQFMIKAGRTDVTPVKPRCPGNFATVSRYIFSPHPSAELKNAGEEQGKGVLRAVSEWLKATRHERLGSLAGDIKHCIQEDDQARKVVTSEDEFSRNLAGVLLGFPPTVQGNFLRVMENWIEQETLWDHQQSLVAGLRGSGLSFTKARDALRDEVFATMRLRPVPGMLWRSPTEHGEADLRNASKRVVLGIASALTNPSAPDGLVFGRDCPTSTNAPPIHGCPGHAMAMGVLLGMISGLLDAGMLRPTGSPVLLILTPCKPEPGNPSS